MPSIIGLYALLDGAAPGDLVAQILTSKEDVEGGAHKVFSRALESHLLGRRLLNLAHPQAIPLAIIPMYHINPVSGFYKTEGRQ